MVIIGDSNIRNTFNTRLKRLDANNGVKSEYVSATSFTAGCEALKNVSGAAIVLICFLLNGISDAAELCANEEEIEAKISEVVDAYCAAIVASTLAKPGIKHYVLSSFFRSSPEWMGAKLSNITDMVKKKARTQPGCPICALNCLCCYRSNRRSTLELRITRKTLQAHRALHIPRKDGRTTHQQQMTCLNTQLWKVGNSQLSCHRLTG